MHNPLSHAPSSLRVKCFPQQGVDVTTMGSSSRGHSAQRQRRFGDASVLLLAPFLTIVGIEQASLLLVIETLATSSITAGFSTRDCFYCGEVCESGLPLRGCSLLWAEKSNPPQIAVPDPEPCNGLGYLSKNECAIRRFDRPGAVQAGSRFSRPLSKRRPQAGELGNNAAAEARATSFRHVHQYCT
jgi:hypothetical protein